MYMLLLWKFLQQEILLSTKFVPSFHKRHFPFSFYVLQDTTHSKSTCDSNIILNDRK